MSDAVRIINSVAPVRICDNGGWTDTWFAKVGKVFNVAVSPGIHVQLTARKRTCPTGGKSITIRATHDDCHFGLVALKHGQKRNPLIEAALAHMTVPEDLALDLDVWSEVPPGSSTGTSAAVAVAVLGALDQLKGGRLTPHDLAMAAYHVEAKLLGRECGVQDQLAAAFGGINFIDVHSFPRATVHPVSATEEFLWELESRVVVMFVGKSHDSSEVHKQVIARLAREGHGGSTLESLRTFAESSRDAVARSSLSGLAEAMIGNTEAQEALHPGLLGQGHRAVIKVAKCHGAIGWKVNGAGGNGGSITLIAPAQMEAKLRMITAIQQAGKGFRQIPVRLCRQGLHRWESQNGCAG